MQRNILTPPGPLLNSLLLAALVAACGPSEQPPPPVDTDAVTTVAAEPDSATEKPSAPTEQVVPALATPAAYFGDLGIERVTTPIEIEPVAGGSVLLIIIDALNAKHLGVYGYERPTSPAIDALAERGLTLTNYVANSSWTRPAYATIVTGVPKREHRMELATTSMREEVVTVAERFQAAGFATAAFVGNPLARGRFGFDQGFDDYIDNDKLRKSGFPDDALIARQALKWLKKNRDRQFFAVVFFTAPHAPYRPHAEVPRFYEGLPPGSNVALPLREYKHGMPAGDLAWTVATYDNEIAYSDAQVSKLIAALDEHGLRNKVTVVVTADHGEIFGEHNCFLHTYHMWDPVLRVPFVIDSPAIPVTGKHDDRPFTHVDLAPTLLRLAGAAPGEPVLPGRSIGDDLGDPAANRERQLFSQYNAHGIRRQAMRKARWKLVHHHPVDRRVVRRINALRNDDTPPDPSDLPTLSYKKDKYELFDLVADPGELKDLHAERRTEPETTELIGELNSLIGGDETDLRIELDEETLEALRAAGYIADSRKKTKK
jgi:arylsulfatase